MFVLRTYPAADGAVIAARSPVDGRERRAAVISCRGGADPSLSVLAAETSEYSEDAELAATADRAAAAFGLRSQPSAVPSGGDPFAFDDAPTETGEDGPRIRAAGDRAAGADLALLADDAAGFRAVVWPDGTAAGSGADFAAVWEHQEFAPLREFPRRLEADGWRLEEARAALAASGCPDASLLLWYAAPGETGRVRRQAASVMPPLAAFIASRPDLRETVDARRPLTAALAAYFPHLKAGGFKRLARITGGAADQTALAEPFAQTFEPDALGNARARRQPLDGPWRSEEAVRFLDRAVSEAGGVGILPDCNEEWRAFTAVYSGMIKPLAGHLGSQAESVSLPNGRWSGLRAALSSDLELMRDAERLDLNVAVTDAVELADRLAEDIVIPTVIAAARAGAPGAAGMPPQQIADGLGQIGPRARMTARRAALDSLFPGGKQPLRALARSVRRGITRLTALEDIRGGGDGAAREAEASARGGERDHIWRHGAEIWGDGSPRNASWEPPWDKWTAPNGTVITFIASREELRAEGTAMGHCIGSAHSYWIRCWEGGAAAAHLRRGDKRATAFFGDIGADPRNARIEQLHGPRNARVNQPGNPLREAAHDFLRAAAAGGIPVRPERAAFMRWRETAPEGPRFPAALSPADRLKPFCGGRDPFDEEMTLNLWSVWRDALPSASRTEIREAMVWRRPESRELLRALSPEIHEAMLNAARPRRRAAAGAEPEAA